MPNAEELNATLADIRENPHLWDQGDYAQNTDCGTVACFYGRTLLRHGYNALGMREYEIEKIVSRILGLNRNEANAMAFYMTGNVDDLELRVKEIIAGEWAEPRVDYNEVVW